MTTLRYALPLQRDWRGGGPPEWQPRFTGRQIREARALAREHNARHSHVQRARLALLLYRHPEMTSPEAARRLGQSSSWVYKWRRRWVLEGFTLEDLPRPGRVRVFSPSGASARGRGGVRTPEPA